MLFLYDVIVSHISASLRDRSLFMWGGKSWGGSGLFFFREKGWTKSEFNHGWEWVFVCFVKNHTHYIGDSVVDGATLDWEHVPRLGVPECCVPVWRTPDVGLGEIYIFGQQFS